MLQNKIYQNYCLEIIKIFTTILLSLSLIAWTVRAVNFLDLIVESGYSVATYFEYSILNVFGSISANTGEHPACSIPATVATAV